MRRPMILGVGLFLLGCQTAAAPDPAPSAAPARSASAADPTVTRQPFVRGAVTGASMRVRWQVPERDGQLTTAQLTALAPRIARLRAEPDQFTMDASAGLPLAQLLRVYAEDDAGTVLGEVRQYGFAMYDGLFIDSLGILRGREVGTGLFVVSIPERVPGEFRTRGPVVIRIAITDSSGRLPRLPEIPRGTNVVSGIVTDSAGRPVSNVPVRALLRVDGRPRSAGVVHTDLQGRYRLEQLPAGAVTIIVSGLGREAGSATVQVVEGQLTQQDIRLAPVAPQPLLRPAADSSRPPAPDRSLP